MKQTVVQLMVGLLGLFVLVWGEAKHYIQSHPEIINTFQLEAKRAEPLVYYNYQVAYDPNSGKTWYYYGDGFWYDKPPQIRKREDKSQKALGDANGTQRGSTSNNFRQSAEASTYTPRY
jgi:hypothetical protein